MAKYNFVKGIYHFGSPKTKKFRLRRAYGNAKCPKSAYGKSFEGSIFRLWEREMPQKVLMGKVLAVDPYTLGGGGVVIRELYI